MELLPEAFRIKHNIPAEYNVPDIMQYSYMIHMLSKTYGISRYEAGQHREVDFWEMLAFENLDKAKEEYLINKAQS